MPKKGMRWRHIIINTRSSWLHGDPRGFRSRSHRIHSSGDYQNPPPAGEHAQLFQHRRSKSQPEVHIPKQLRASVGRAAIEFFRELDRKVLVVAVAKVHLHLLVELSNDIQTVRKIAGDLKRATSRAVRKEMPGTVWARGGKYKPVRSVDHQRKAFRYILFKQGHWACTWSFKDGSDVGRFGRALPE